MFYRNDRLHSPLSWVRVLAGVVSVAVLAGCQGQAKHTEVTPLTGEQEKTHQKIVASYGGELKSPPVQGYVNNVAEHLRQNGGTPIRVYLVNSADVNHFSLPGGHVYVTRGLLQSIDNEAQLAAVLALEMGHLNKGHVQNRIEEAQREAQASGRQQSSPPTTTIRFTELLTGKQKFPDILRDIAVGPVLTPDGKFGGKFTEAEENAATEDALTIMHKAGYDPTQFHLYLNTMLTQEQTAGEANSDVLATHNVTTHRVVHVQQRIQSRFPEISPNYKVGSDAYAENVSAHIASSAAQAAG